MWFYVGEKHKYIDIEYIEMQILKTQSLTIICSYCLNTWKKIGP